MDPEARVTSPVAVEECVVQVYAEELGSLGRPPTLGELQAIVGASAITITKYCQKHGLALSDGRALRHQRPAPAGT